MAAASSSRKQKFLEELRAAFADESARAVIAARGGYGLTRIAHAVGTGCLRDAPKWIVGFSESDGQGRRR